MKIIGIVSRISVSFDAIWVIIWGGIGSLWVETPAWHRLIQKHAAHTNRLQLMQKAQGTRFNKFERLIGVNAELSKQHR